MIIGVITALIIAIVGITAVSQSSKMSERSFDAVVQEIVTQPDGEVRLIVERTTEIYGDPVNSLGISEDTKLLDADGNEISVNDFKQGSKVAVNLKDPSSKKHRFIIPMFMKSRGFIIDYCKILWYSIIRIELKGELYAGIQIGYTVFICRLLCDILHLNLKLQFRMTKFIIRC